MRDSWAGLYILNEHGEPEPCYDTLAWGRWMEANRFNRHVAKDYDEGDSGKQIWISTVFLGVDHNFLGTRPLLYETMAFLNGHEMDGMTRRYSTRDEAALGHQQVCELVMKAISAAAAKEPHG